MVDKWRVTGVECQVIEGESRVTTGWVFVFDQVTPAPRLPTPDPDGIHSSSNSSHGVKFAAVYREV